jgi:MFS family permease
MSYAALLRREPRALAFGLLHTLAATIGQTFVISLFLPGIKAAYALGDAYLALLFTATTLASAAALWTVGGWMDRVDVIRYSVASALLLVFACATLAAAPGLFLFITGFFCLRLAGNGLLTHFAVTATARYFARDRGQALSVVLLGSSVGEAGFPLVLVSLIGFLGWRWALVATGCFGLLLVIVAAAAVRHERVFRAPVLQTISTGEPPPPAAESTQSARANRRYFAWTAPLFVAMPMVVTATIFHQALLADAKAVSLEWFAVSFIAFAVVRVPVSIITGRLVDRLGSHWLFCLHLVPLAAGLTALNIAATAWIVPFYWLCAGIASGMGTVLQTTIIAERVTRERLARARSIGWAVAIVASALGPSFFGLGLAGGLGAPAIVWLAIAFLLVATVLGIRATRDEYRTPPDNPLSGTSRGAAR